MQRRSKKRDAILQCLRSTTAHPTAERVYQELLPRFPDLSLATVYRNLAQFREEGLIRCVETTDSLRFDGQPAPHAHFCCRSCGRVEDRFEVVLPTLPGEEVDGMNLVFYGICRECKKK